MIKRALIALLIMTGSARAQVQPCLVQDPGWVTPYSQGTIQSVAYGLNSKILVAAYRQNAIRAFAGVPPNIANRFTSLTNADSYFSANVAPYYHESLLTEWSGGPCPILTETGSWLYTH